MAITTARIQMRRGLLNDFDPSKMTAGEWAVSIDLETDRQIVYMCFSPGIVKRMGTLEDFEEQIREATNNVLEQYKTELNQIKISAIEETTQIKNSAIQELNSLIDNFNTTSSQLMIEIENAKNSVEQSKAYISTFENELKTILIPKIEENVLKTETFSISAENSKIQSENFANQSKRWAIGIDEEPSSLTDNSKYYSEEAKRYAEQAESTVGFGIATTEKAGIVKPDGVTITVAEDGTISGANKVDIATSTTVGVVKPSQDLTITPDGTLGINTLFSMIEERANIQSGDTWETVLAKINKNLGDLKPLAFLDKVTESYLDTLIANKINNAIQKSQIVNNTVTEVEGTVLDGRVGKNLQDQIVKQINDITNKVISNCNILEYCLLQNSYQKFLIDVSVTGMPYQGYWMSELFISYSTRVVTITNGYGLQYLNWHTGSDWIGWKPMSISITKKHQREIIKTGTIFEFVSSKINEGYDGGEIEIVGVFYKPSDTYNNNEWGIANWIKSASSIATIFFYPDRATQYGYRSIVPSENFDTGWITK